VRSEGVEEAMSCGKAKTASVALAIVACAGAAPTARAGGIFVPGYGVQAQPRAGAFVAKADDPSALYYNPAGFARQRGTTLQIGANLLDLRQTATREGTFEAAPEGDEPWTGRPFETMTESSSPKVGLGPFQLSPSLLVATDLGGRTPLVYGFGIISENASPDRSYGDAISDYTFEDPDAPPPGLRYDGVRKEGTAAFLSAAAAYSFGDLDIGARLSWGIATFAATTYVWAIRNYEEDIHRDAKFELDNTDWFIPAGQLGALYRVSPAIELGAQYTTQRSISASGNGIAILGNRVGLNGIQDYIAPITGGEARCADGGTLAQLKTCTEFALPQTATIGGRYVFRGEDGAERGDLELDLAWEDWSNASDIKIVVDGRSGVTGVRLEDVFIRHGFHDTFGARLGGGWAFPIDAHTLEVRGGVAYDTAAAPLGWTRTDFDGAAKLTLGSGVGFSFGSTRIDVGGGYVFQPRRVVESTCQPTNEAPGCDGSGGETAVLDRDQPDPLQPLNGPLNQVESPYNAGTYEQSYVLLSAGVTHSF
jgi:long-chain fatty acid transport protein